MDKSMISLLLILYVMLLSSPINAIIHKWTVIVSHIPQPNCQFYNINKAEQKTFKVKVKIIKYYDIFETCWS